MKNLIKIELKKAIVSKYFLIGMLLLLLFSLLSAVYMLNNRADYNPESILTEYYYEDGAFKTNPDLPIFSAYNSWVGAEIMSLAHSLFFHLLPVGAAIPFAWTFYSERKSGYIKNVAIRTKKINYYIAKTIAVFTSGCIAVFIPYIVNILIIFAFVPSITPFAGYTFYNYIYFGNMWADIYFTNPVLYIALYVLLNTIYGGIFALLSFMVTFYINNIFAVLFLPFITFVVLNFTHDIIDPNYLHRYAAYNPTSFLHSLYSEGDKMWQPVVIVTLILLFVSILTIFIRGYKDEVF